MLIPLLGFCKTGHQAQSHLAVIADLTRVELPRASAFHLQAPGNFDLTQLGGRVFGPNATGITDKRAKNRGPGMFLVQGIRISRVLPALEERAGAAIELGFPLRLPRMGVLAVEVSAPHSVRAVARVAGTTVIIIACTLAVVVAVFILDRLAPLVVLLLLSIALVVVGAVVVAT